MERPGRNAQTLQAFFDHLGERKQSIRAVSIDMSGGYEKAVRAALPDAQLYFDPFHVVRLGARATDQSAGRMEPPRPQPHPDRPLGSREPAGRCSRHPSARPSSSSPRPPKSRPPAAASIAPSCSREELRLLYHLPNPALAPDHLDAWPAWAARSWLTPFVRLARTLREHREGILAAIRHGLSNGHLEGLNSKIRLISHRAFGFHSPRPADRRYLPVLRRHHNQAPTMTVTPKPGRSA